MEVTNNQQPAQIIPEVSKEVAQKSLNSKDQETVQKSSGVTVNLTSEALDLASTTEKGATSQLKITNAEQAEKSVVDFKNSAERDSPLTQSVQSNVTANKVVPLLS